MSSNQWSTGIWRSAKPLGPSLYQHEHSGGLSAHAGALDAWPQEHEVFPLRPGKTRWQERMGEGGREVNENGLGVYMEDFMRRGVEQL